MTQVQVSWAQLVLPLPIPMANGYPPGSLWFTFPRAPVFGAPFRCVPWEAGGLGPVTPRQYRLLNGSGRPLADPFSPPGAGPDYGCLPLNQAAALLARWQAYLQPPVPGPAAGPGQINPACGNLVVRLAPPLAGPFDPAPLLVYNSQDPADSEFGYGWSLVPKQTLTSLTSATVNVVEGTGTPLRYRLRDPGTNLYLGPGGSNDALQFNTDDQTWTQTQPDGFEVHYDASGRTSYLASPAGDRWTLSYDSGNRVTAIADPFARSTAFAYDASYKVRQIQQPDGRVTSVTVDASGDLVGCVYPDGGRVTLAYDGHQLTGFTDPRGEATGYAYDDSGRVSQVTTPAEEATAYDYRPGGITGGPTRVTDANSQVTTLLFNLDRNIAGVIDPLGHRSTYLWDTHRLTGFLDADGNRSTLTYAQQADRTYRLASIVDAMRGRYTFLYDSTGAVVALQDQLGRETDLQWGGAGGRDRQVVTDALGGQTNCNFNGHGQVAALSDPLTHRTTLLFDGVGRVAAAVNPLLQRTSFAYDANSQVRSLLDALLRRTTSLHDPMNRETARIDALGNRTSYLYDAAGNPRFRTDPLGRVWSFTYDADGRPAAQYNPLNQQTAFAYTPVGLLQSTTDPLGRVSAGVYDAASRLLAAVDPSGQRTTYGYDPAGNRTSVLDPLLRRSSFVYDPNNFVRASVNALLQRTTFLYDAANRRTGMVDALGRRTTNVYDPLHRMVGTVNALNRRWTTVYDAAGRNAAAFDPLLRRASSVYDAADRNVASVNPLLQRATTVYDAAGQAVAGLDPLLRRSSTVYDPAGWPLAGVNPLNQRNTSIYDAAGQKVAAVDPLLRRSSLAYDPAGRLLAAVNPLKQRTSTVYDAAGQAVGRIDALTRRSSTVYDLNGRTLATVNPLLQRTTNVYDAAGQGVAVIDALTHRSSTAYDLAGRVLASVNPLNQRNTSVYDAAGQAVARIDPLLKRTSSVYDRAGRTVAAIDALAFRSTTVYDVAGQAVAALDPLARRGSTVYDPAGRVIVRIDPTGARVTTAYDAAGQTLAVSTAWLGGTPPAPGRALVFALPAMLGTWQDSTVRYSYDPAGRRVALTDPNGHPSFFAFDAAGQKVFDTDPLGRRTTFAYDPAGRRILRIDPRGVAVTSTYDAAGQRVGELYPAGLRATYAYDDASRPVLAADAAGRVTTAYDPKGRVSSTVNPDGKSITYAYDAADRRLSMTDPDGGRTSYSHDPAGRLAVLTEPRGNATSFTYDPTGRRVLQLGANTARITSVYDAAGQLTGLNTTAAGAPVSRFTYAYDPASRRTGAWQAAAGALVRSSWSYDPAGQLVCETRTGIAGFDTTYTYDPAGNRKVQIDGGVPTNYAYDAANELLTAVGPGGLTSYTYDPAGNRTVLDAPSATTYYAWDARGRLAVVEPVAGAVTYAYDARSRRLGKQTPTQNTRYVYDFAKVLQETDGSGTTQQQYLNTEEQYGDLVSAYGGGQGAYFACDALGSADALLDDTGSATDRYAYRAFGAASHTQGSSANDRTFVARQGYLWDLETELYFLGTTPYAPDTAGTIRRDPAEADPNRNDYRYCGNDPINATDPSGLVDVATIRDDFAKQYPIEEQYFRQRLHGLFLVHEPYLFWSRVSFRVDYTANGEKALRIFAQTTAPESEVFAYALEQIQDLGGDDFRVFRKTHAPLKIGDVSLIHSGAEARQQLGQPVPPAWTEEEAWGFRADAAQKAMVAHAMAESLANRPSGAAASGVEEEEPVPGAPTKGRLVQPRGCFPADTPVTTEDGLKPIQTVRRSDRVWGYDLASGEWKLRRVVETYEHDYEGDLVALAVEGEVIEATSNHPFWVIEVEGLGRREPSDHVPATPPDAWLPGRWVDAGNLRAGDVLLLKSGRRATISRLSMRQVRQKVYNFQVEEVHTYAVGNSQVLVHNKPMEWAPVPEGPVGKLTNPDEPWFEARGLDPHEIKKDIIGGKGQISRYDVFKDQNGNLWVLPKNGRGEPQWWGRWVEK